MWKSGACTVAKKSYGIKALNGNIEGMNELLAKLDMLPEAAAMAAEQGIRDSAQNIVVIAKANVPDGRLRQNITTDTERNGAKVHCEVFVQPAGYIHTLWPVFLEMGTGPKGIASGGNKYPLQPSDYAQHPWWYYDQKLGHVVKTDGRYAQPYLWPAYLTEKPYILANVKDAVAAYMAQNGGGKK